MLTEYYTFLSIIIIILLLILVFMFSTDNNVSKNVNNGCKKSTFINHNGIYCLIKDWSNKDLETGKKGRKIKFIETLKQNLK